MNFQYVFQREKDFIDETFAEEGDFHLIEGKNNVMLSAPHATTHFRNGKDKIGEFRTGCVVDYLCSISDCHGIYKTKNNHNDPNYDDQNAYKDAVVSYIQEHNIQYFFDLHIMASHREHMIDLGTGDGSNIQNKEFPGLVCSLFKQGGFEKTEIDLLFRACNANCVSSTVARECGIDAIQIETNWTIYESEEDALRFVEALLNIITALEEK